MFSSLFPTTFGTLACSVGEQIRIVQFNGVQAAKSSLLLQLKFIVYLLLDQAIYKSRN